MLNDAGLRMAALAGKGYCCTQIMLLLALEDMGRENPDLIRASAGLCDGLGDCTGPCGVITGALCFMSLHAAKGMDMEEADDRLPLMVEELRGWFAEVAGEVGGTNCVDIIGGNCGSPDPVLCGSLMSRAYDKVREILAANSIDPSEGRNE